MSPWKVILATLVIFCSGLVVGGLVVKKRLVSSQMPQAFQRAGHSNVVLSAGHLQQKEFIRRIERELILSPEQRERIERILKESQERTKLIREKMAPEMRDELKKVRDEIRAELEPEQQEKFEKATKVRTPRKSDDSTEEFRRKKDGTRRSHTNAPSTNVIQQLEP